VVAAERDQARSALERRSGPTLDLGEGPVARGQLEVAEVREPRVRKDVAAQLRVVVRGTAVERLANPGGERAAPRRNDECSS
jgi:hypothetical protein